MWAKREFAVTGGDLLTNMNMYNDISMNFNTYTEQIRNLCAAIEYILILTLPGVWF